MKPQRKLFSLVEPTAEPAAVATPFVKWVGGKRVLLPAIRKYAPDEFNNYHEGFVGGGAVFFAIGSKAKKAHLSDRNFDLVICYQVIKEDPTHLIARLKEHADAHDQDYYYEVRASEPKDPVEVAARFIYLNKTCFNGLYRVNKSGKFNVPIGSYKNPNIIQEENVLACHAALKNATIRVGDFATMVKPKEGDFCYFDPPYDPTTDASFTEYTHDSFTEHDQVRLRDFILKLHKAGTYIMLSNSKTKFIESLYSSKIFKKYTVRAPRTVNCKADARGAVDEILITNY
jgi:DNA adenine methylase